MSLPKSGKLLIHIGTSGWHYDHWRGPFYPQELASEDFLAYYHERFDTVELNNTFYRLPSPRTFESWRHSVGDDFIFSVKASRYITHLKKLKDPRPPLAHFFENLAPLTEKVGVILFQLPPRWRMNLERLQGFLEALPSDFRYTFEFRDPSWFDDRIYRLLAEFNAAFCIYDLDGKLSPKEVTANFVYIRLHGPDGPYQGKYDTRTLCGWAGAISAWVAEGKEVYCYFDNDQAGYAVENALELKRMLQR
ncbi:MAG: DUF72 domain-containing protein [Methylohalobius crimeensis]